MALIDKDKALDAISMYLFVNDAVRNDVKVGDYRVFAKSMICDVPEVDIVRCKECRHNYSKALNHGKMQPRCDFTDRKLSENDYCSRGEREGE